MNQNILIDNGFLHFVDFVVDGTQLLVIGGDEIGAVGFGRNRLQQFLVNLGLDGERAGRCPNFGPAL